MQVFHVPIETAALSLCTAASTLRAVILPVRGFSEGMFLISIENEALSLSTVIVC